MAKRSKPARYKAFGILNPWGDVWGPNWFDTEAEAHQYLVDFWKQFPGGQDLSKFKVVPVRVTVSALPNRSRDGASPQTNEPQPHPSREEKS